MHNLVHNNALAKREYKRNTKLNKKGFHAHHLVHNNALARDVVLL